MNQDTLILASASPRRAELLRQLGWDFEIVPSDIAEIDHEHLTASELAQVNAYRKARAVSKKFPDNVVLGVDTLVTADNKIYGKPLNLEDAHRILQALQGKTHQVVTGVCLIHLRVHRQKVFADLTDVTFRPLTLEQIRHYHTQTDPLDKAGAYGIQENGDLIVERISGSFSNVVGLPVERLEAEFHAFEAAVG